MIDHRDSNIHNLCSCEIRAWKKVRLEWDSNLGLTIGAVLYQLSYQANWELVKIGFLNLKEPENGFCISLLNKSIQDLSDHGVLLRHG